MTQNRSRPADAPFVGVPNATARDGRLSFKARGLLVYLLSFPRDWRFHVRKMAEEGQDGQSAIRSGLAELEEAGYLRRTAERDERGKITCWLWALEFVSTSTPAESTCGKSTCGKSLTTKTVDTKKVATKTTTQPPVAFDDDGPTTAPQEPDVRAPSFEETRDALVSIWNESCGELTKTRVVSREVEKLMRAAHKRHGAEQLVQLFRKGIKIVRDDEHWLGERARRPTRQGKPYGLVNYLRHMEDYANQALEVEADAPRLDVKAGETWYTDLGIVRIDVVDDEAVTPYKGRMIRPTAPGWNRGDEVHLAAESLRRRRV